MLLAVGQTVDIAFVDGERDGLEITDRGFIACDQETGQTSAADVFVAGDLATGPKLLIHAVASGKAVARAVYQSITGGKIGTHSVELHLALPRYDREWGYEHQPRVPVPTNPVSERIRSHVAPVELGFSEEEARREAQRCLDCGINTIFDGTKCILCGGCVDVCPERCLRIVSVDRLDHEAALGKAVDAQLGDTDPEAASAILKDETICIRCGACADRCPTGAITMERFSFKETPKCLTS